MHGKVGVLKETIDSHEVSAFGTLFWQEICGLRFNSLEDVCHLLKVLIADVLEQR